MLFGRTNSRFATQQKEMPISITTPVHLTLTLSIISSRALSACPIKRMQWWIRPGPKRPWKHKESINLKQTVVRWLLIRGRNRLIHKIICNNYILKSSKIGFTTGTHQPTLQLKRHKNFVLSTSLYGKFYTMHFSNSVNITRANQSY